MEQKSIDIISQNIEANFRKNISMLSERENEVLSLIAEGLENKAISKRLFISVKTVEFHKENIKQKLGVRRVEDLYNFNYGKINLCR